MADINQLLIRIDATTEQLRRELRRADQQVAQSTQRMEKELGRVDAAMRRVESAAGAMAHAAQRLLAPLAALISATATLNKLVSTARTFQTLQAALETATGSADNAARAFEALQDFARETPYGLEQATQAFIKLVNMGLEPSERALRAYGNTASAMGKSLDQMIEAVADAAVAEFERLKEFGIRAKNEGDTIAFTFQGVTTRVANNARAIEEYLISLGEVQFAGGMERQMQTLEGAIANLADSWDMLFHEINEAGVGTVIEDAVRQATAAIDELTAMIASGELGAYIDALGGKFVGFGEDFADTADFVQRYWNVAMEALGTDARTAVQFIVDAFLDLPENIRAIVRLIVVEIASLVDYGKAYGAAFAEVIGIQFSALVDKAAVYGRAIRDALNPFAAGTSDIEAEMRRINGVVAARIDEAFNRARQQAEITAQTRRESIEIILHEREAAISSFDAQIEKAKQLRAEYRQLQEARAASQAEDRLAGFRVGGGADGAGEARGSLERERALQGLQDLRRRVQEQQRLNQALMQSAAAYERVRQEIERENAVRQFEAALVKAGVKDAANLVNAYEDEYRQLQQLQQAHDELLDQRQRGQEFAKQLGLTFSSAFEDAIVKMENLRDITSALLEDILRAIVRMQITQPLVNAVGSYFGGGAAPTANADGNAFHRGHVIPFARGGIVTGPTLFPMANGTGLMGEAGPEAIMPLKRGPDGKLGVVAQGVGGVHISVYQTIDARGQGEQAANNIRNSSREMADLIINTVVSDIRRRGAIPSALGVK